jgi:hypothetical protein
MILYNVTVSIDYDVNESWLKWMKETHIPNVLSTGLFIENKIAKIHAEEEGGISYSIQYLLKSWEDYHHYIDNFSAELQKEYQLKYANKSVAFRTVLEIIHVATP